tara:strand:+ start:735 stop:1109 length:375 start_codon:yes stop_codon:yes gene_type:complete
MKGITEAQQKELTERYAKMYHLYINTDSTLQEIGDMFGVSRQRVFQVIQRCKLGQGDYYGGGKIARLKWKEISENTNSTAQTWTIYQDWLKKYKIKIANNNRNFAFYRGVKNAERESTVETTEG